MNVRCGCHTPPVEWTGTATCHCSTCGLLFAGVTGFDDHLSAKGCLSVAAIKRRGYMEVGPGVWGAPRSTGTPGNGHRGRAASGKFEVAQ